ncbi:MAG: nucleotidyltransferase domain-containing protein [Anaerolineae bacterium]|nr:nucleotidyltransferase domain-containing protein [Anaerolineae bacterium]
MARRLAQAGTFTQEQRKKDTLLGTFDQVSEGNVGEGRGMKLPKRTKSNKQKRSLKPKDLIQLRKAILPVLEPYGVKRLALFGSVARGKVTSKSDIDILVDFEEPRRKPLGLLRWVELEEELERRLGRKVDLVSNTGLNRYIRPYVEKEMVIIYDTER